MSGKNIFHNEMTYLRMSKEGNEKEFHRLYEDAVEKVKQELGKHHPMYIDDRPVYSEGGEFNDISPCDTRIVIGYFQKGTREHAKLAIQVAKRSFKEWSKQHYLKRTEIFWKAANIMSERKFELAAIITLENGKNRYEAMADVDEAIDYLRYYSYLVEKNRGFEKPMGSVYPNENAKSIMKPCGVWGVIPPFNFPLAITVGMSTGAMVTGNTIVLKPASDTPYIALKFYEIMKEAGLPRGVFNYITGPGGEVGAELVENEQVDGIAFTGSWEVGAKSYAKFSSKTPRPFIAEMGGKNATIVTDKADLDKAVEGVIRGAFGYGGQKCSATSRLIVHRAIKDRFLNMLVKKAKELKVGMPTEKDVFLGPLINSVAYEKFKKYSEIAKRDGKLLCGGEVLTEGDLRYGFYVQPTIVDGLPKDHEMLKEEIFVPILAVIDYEDLSEAVNIANDVRYGLTAGIFSQDKEEIKYFFDNIEAGVVYANRTVGSTTGAVVGVQPFGGWKHSGSTGKGAGGLYYLYQFMREQSQSIYD